MISSKFTFFPTVASGLSVTTYAVSVPASRQWALLIPRLGESSVALAGNAVHSVLAKDVSNAAPVYSQIVTEAEYQSLRLLDEHATQTSWMLSAQGRAFEIIMDITKADIVYRQGVQKRDIEIKIKIVSEE